MLNSNEPVIPLKSSTTPTTPTYPPNRSGWLHKFSNILARAEVAREIGRDAAFLILAIAIQEDAQQYQSAPIYFDAELQRMTGIRSRKQLDKVRQKAVDAGYLIVGTTAGGDPSVARYWTNIPNRLNVFDDPIAEGVAVEQANLQSQVIATPNEMNESDVRKSDTVQNAVPAIAQPNAAQPILPGAIAAQSKKTVEHQEQKSPQVDGISSSKLHPVPGRPTGQQATIELSPQSIAKGIEAGSKTTEYSQAQQYGLVSTTDRTPL